MNQIRILDESTVAAYAIERGVLDAHLPIVAEALSGGVSSAVLSVRQQDRRLVVKQALPKLRVDDDWFANPRRSLVEAEALDVAARVLPGATPAVVDVDADMFALVIAQASPEYVNWRDELLDAVVRPGVGHDIGRFLALWHGAEPLIPSDSQLREQVNLIDLRVSPYYWEVAKRHPNLTRITAGAVRRMLDTRTSAVHGDFSPKNILVGDSGPLILDFEVAHVGDPAFDVAFLLHHLILKSVKLPESSGDLRELAQQFHASYVAAGGAGFDDPQYLFTQVALLALARVDGKSRVGYLDAAEADHVRTVALAMAQEPPETLHDVWAPLTPRP